MRTFLGLLALITISLLTMSCDMGRQKDDAIQREEEYREEDMREDDSFEDTVPVDEGDVDFE